MEILARSETIRLNAAGEGMIVFSPARYTETWRVTRISTVGNSATEPVLQIFRNGQLIDTTRRGNAAVSENDSLTFRSGETLLCKYSGGTRNADMTIYIEGEGTYAV